MTSLELSIAHWERNAAAQIINDIKMGTAYCALCKEHYKNDCKTCPVMQRTGQPFCQPTPYVEAVRVSERLEELIKANRPQEEIQQAWEKWRTAAEAEVEFLKSLREPQE